MVLKSSANASDADSTAKIDSAGFQYFTGRILARLLSVLQRQTDVTRAHVIAGSSTRVTPNARELYGGETKAARVKPGDES